MRIKIKITFKKTPKIIKKKISLLFRTDGNGSGSWHEEKKKDKKKERSNKIHTYNFSRFYFVSQKK